MSLCDLGAETYKSTELFISFKGSSVTDSGKVYRVLQKLPPSHNL